MKQADRRGPQADRTVGRPIVNGFLNFLPQLPAAADDADPVAAGPAVVVLILELYLAWL